jgi:dihydroxy-acid dehydratase
MTARHDEVRIGPPVTKSRVSLRSSKWLDGTELSGFVHRTAFRSSGFSRESFEGRPVVGICNSSSEAVSCNLGFRDLAASVKRGVLQAGGIPLEFPAMSLGEQLMKPTAMLYRNLMSMDVEESIRAYPFDAVVLLGGCDKTVPAQLMGAASADVPTIVVTGGPASPAVFRGRQLGVGTDLWHYADAFRAGDMTVEEFGELEAAAGPSIGHCPEMGTASTMAVIVEGLGMTLPGGAAIPAYDARRQQHAEACGRRAVAIAVEGVRPSHILTPEAFDNAITLLLAVGGSTNAIIHLLAIAGRVGVPLNLARFHELSERTPVIVNVRPSGAFLVEQLFHAGGVPAVLSELAPLLHLDAMTISGTTLASALVAPSEPDRSIIATLEEPFLPVGGLAVVTGNLAPDGAVVKCSAASPELLAHRGPAVVFEDIEDLVARIDDPDLEVSEDSVLVLRMVGPRGGYGMPEWGQLPIPGKLLRAGVRDMVRVSDARMSGTSFGTTVLHVSPEAAAGGSLALVRSGDYISLDARAGVLNLEVDEDELLRRRAVLDATPRGSKFRRGYQSLHDEHVLQAHEGCDFDFLQGRSVDPDLEPVGMLSGWIGGW